jgi:hypothetical protein
MSNLSLQNPLGAIGLSVLGVIVFIYLFHRQYKTLQITGLFLWNSFTRTKEGGKRLERLNFSRSLLLDLLACLALVLAFCVPAFQAADKGLTVIILDNSFSMRADKNFQKAKREAKEIISNLGENEKAIVILAKEQPEVVASSEYGKNKMLLALDEYTPYSKGAAIKDSISLSRNITDGYMHVHVFTDKDIKPNSIKNTSVTYHFYKADFDNLAFTNVFRQISGERRNSENIFLTVANYSNFRKNVNIKISDIKNTISFNRNAEIDAEKKKSFEFQISELLKKDIKVSIINHSDKLDEDSTIILSPEPELKVLYYIDNLQHNLSSPFRAALNASGAFETSNKSFADLYITQNESAQSQNNITTIRLVKQKEVPAVTVGPFIINYYTDLCDDLSLSGVYWGFNKNFPVRKNIVPLISVDETPLCWFEDGSTIVMNLAIDKSNIKLMPCWPALISNIVRYSRNSLAGIHKANYYPSEKLQYVYSALKDKRITFKNKNKLMPSTGSVPAKPGNYTLISKNKKFGKISVNAIFPNESNLLKLSDTTKIENQKPDLSEELPKSFKLLSIPCLLFALACLILNWWLDFSVAQKRLKGDAS